MTESLAMTDHFTVFIRLPFPRGEFEDPPPVIWTAAKQKVLWEVLSQPTNANIDWAALATDLDVSLPFLEQQAAWLYQRHLAQVRAQMRKVGVGNTGLGSASPSPVPGQTAGLGLKRPDSIASRGPSRLSIRAGATDAAPSTPRDSSISNTPVLPSSFSLRQQVSHARHGSATSTRQVSVPIQSAGIATDSGLGRRGSLRERERLASTRSPEAAPTSSSSSSSDSETEGPGLLRRQNTTTGHKKFGTLSTYKASRMTLSRDDIGASIAGRSRAEIDSDEEDDTPAFLPMSTSPKATYQDATEYLDDQYGQSQGFESHDPSATLRLEREARRTRPHAPRRSTSERMSLTSHSQSTDADLDSAPQSQDSQRSISMTTSSSTDSSSAVPQPRRYPVAAVAHPQRHSQGSHGQRHHHSGSVPGGQMQPLSPRRTAELSRRDGSDGKSSMGSSFSDLDDASLTESALQEAYLHSHGNRPGMASRMTSTISQALRSRHF